MQHPDNVHLKKPQTPNLHRRQALTSGGGRGKGEEWINDVASWRAGAANGVLVLVASMKRLMGCSMASF